MDKIYQRAIMLFQTKRFDEAEKLLQKLLAGDANNVYYLSLMAEIKIQQDKPKEAEDLINSAIGIQPDLDRLYYIKAYISTNLDKYDEAENMLQQAVELDPENADYYAAWSSIKLTRKKYQASLDLADKALELDAENVNALNVRSSALIKLNRKEESFQTIEGALREDPNNAHTHANYGWNLLEKREYKKAMIHFGEALKNDPNNAYAQSGMMNAIKASNIFYRLFLMYAFWIQKFSKKFQWGIIIGFLVAYQLLSSVARNNPALEPFITPLLILYTIFAFSTWIITPVSNLFLRLHKYGRHLLDDQEKLSSNIVGISFLVFLAGLLGLLFTNHFVFLLVAAFGFTMMLPLGVMLKPEKNKFLLIAYTVGLAMVGIGNIVMVALVGAMYSPLIWLYLIGIFAFQFVANWALINEGNK
jgi:tetratricopeptide (TPR) repeat protein